MLIWFQANFNSLNSFIPLSPILRTKGPVIMQNILLMMLLICRGKYFVENIWCFGWCFGIKKGSVRRHMRWKFLTDSWFREYTLMQEKEQVQEEFYEGRVTYWRASSQRRKTRYDLVPVSRSLFERSFHNYEIASLKDPLEVDSLYFSSSPYTLFTSFNRPILLLLFLVSSFSSSSSSKSATHYPFPILFSIDSTLSVVTRDYFNASLCYHRQLYPFEIHD